MDGYDYCAEHQAEYDAEEMLERDEPLSARDDEHQWAGVTYKDGGW